MTTDFQALVRQFHEASGQTVGERPHDVGPGLRLFRANLIGEEAGEAYDALAYGHTLPEVARELVDLLYVTFGTAVALGIDLGPVFREVHRANMAKVAGKVERSASGKILKPPGWQPPDVARVLREQGWTGGEQ